MHIIANLTYSLPLRFAPLYMPKVLRPLDSSKGAPGNEMGTATEMAVNRWNKHIRNLQPKIGYSDRTCSHDPSLLVIWTVMVIK